MNVVNIYELNLGVFARLKERSRCYNWKGLRSYDYNGYNPDLVTLTDIMIIVIGGAKEHLPKKLYQVHFGKFSLAVVISKIYMY